MLLAVATFLDDAEALIALWYLFLFPLQFRATCYNTMCDATRLKGRPRTAKNLLLKFKFFERYKSRFLIFGRRLDWSLDSLRIKVAFQGLTGQRHRFQNSLNLNIIF